MIDDSKTLETIGNYWLQQCDSFYREYSGYAYIVCHQASFFCAPKQLAGFGANELERAKDYLHKKAKAGAETRKFQRAEKATKDRLAKGWLPVQHEDREHRMHMERQGYRLMETTREHGWYAKPEPTLFQTAKPTP